MSTTADLAVDALATYRLTRLAAEDKLTMPLRDRAVEWAEERQLGRVGELLTCRWCMGVWIGAGVVVARRVAPAVWAPVARGLAFAAVAGMLVTWES